MPAEIGGLRVATPVAALSIGPDEIASVGRHPASRVQVDDELVSRQHAVLRRHQGCWVLEDLGSRNGTYFAGDRVTRLVVAGTMTVRLGDPEYGPILELEPVTRPGPAVHGPPDPGPPTATPGPPDPGPPTATVGLGLLTASHRPEATVRIGRSPENEIVVDDLLVSRAHAEVRIAPGLPAELVDLGSHNGTFVNGRRVDRAPLGPQDVVSVGSHRFRLVGSTLEEYIDAGPVSFTAAGLTVETAAGKVLLDSVSFALQPRCLLGVVGPSGSGKSTLINALTGFRPATGGSVRYDGRDLYEEYDDLRHRIGLVPQEDIVHEELTVGRAVEFAAELRFPADVAAVQRLARVDEVLHELGLADRRDLAIRHLSGGQRKRVSIAPELLTRPSLLFMDEPTSGLDPGYERSVMELLRALADAGRTVVVVTHSVSSLHLCDRLLFLAPGGQVAYFGPPAHAVASFGRSDYQQVFADLNHEERDWAARFRTTDDYERYVASPLGEHAPRASGAAPPSAPARPQGWFRQFATLTRRYLAVIAGDRRYLGLLLLQGPLLGLLFLAALPPGQLAASDPGELRFVSQAAVVLLVMALGVTGLGASNAVREIVKELPLFRRERAVGLSVTAYVASKMAVLAPLAAVQGSVIVVLGLARQHGPPDAVALGSPTAELAAAAAMGGVAAVALGLLISALSANTDRATTLLPVVLVVQLVLAMAGVGKPVLEQLSYVSGTQWTLTAAAATSDLNRLQAGNLLLRELPTIDLDNPQPALDALRQKDRGEPLQRHEARAWWTSMAALAVLTAASVVGASTALLRHDPSVP
ncbi:MAG: FHA domain-containing protein [Acidimicrobiales bacterium]